MIPYSEAIDISYDDKEPLRSQWQPFHFIMIPNWVINPGIPGNRLKQSKCEITQKFYVEIHRVKSLSVSVPVFVLWIWGPIYYWQEDWLKERGPCCNGRQAGFFCLFVWPLRNEKKRKAFHYMVVFCFIMRSSCFSRGKLWIFFLWLLLGKTTSYISDDSCPFWRLLQNV